MKINNPHLLLLVMGIMIHRRNILQNQVININQIHNLIYLSTNHTYNNQLKINKLSILILHHYHSVLSVSIRISLKLFLVKFIL
jgi:hypothetical protein